MWALPGVLIADRALTLKNFGAHAETNSKMAKIYGTLLQETVPIRR